MDASAHTKATNANAIAIFPATATAMHLFFGHFYHSRHVSKSTNLRSKLFESQVNTVSNINESSRLLAWQSPGDIV